MQYSAEAGRLFFEDWAAGYGSPYMIDEADEHDEAQLVEEGPMAMAPGVGDHVDGLAFVDGVRRGEGFVYAEGPSGLVRAMAGAHACGAVLHTRASGAVFGPLRLERVLICASGSRLTLPEVDGLRWPGVSVASTDADAPLQELQRRMRQAEGELADSLAEEGWLAVVDGPLTFLRSHDRPVIGFVKTHLRALLPAELHVQVSALGAGQRTPLFALGADRLSCYLRLDERPERASPWHGIVRLEVGQSFGVQRARELVDGAARALPRFAGIPHRDPRAPQNLQPVGALEVQLRRRLGPDRLAARALRRAVTLADPALQELAA